MKKNPSSGQALLIAILLGFLVLVGGTVAVLFTMIETRHQTGSTHRQASRAVADEGLAIAMQQLGASAATWANALNGDFTGTDCNTGNLVTGPSGDSFKLHCSTGMAGNAGLQPYQVAVISVGYENKSGVYKPLRALKSYISQRTLGVDSSDNIHAAAALQLARQPDTRGQLNVHWGPIVCLNLTNDPPWTLPEPIESQLYPRKFSQGGLTGPSPRIRSGSSGASPRTDRKEYIAYMPLNFLPLIDEASYKSQASIMDFITPPTLSSDGSNVPTDGCDPMHTQCGIFKTSGGTAVFDSNYAPPASAVIYIDGNAQFNRINMDGASVIINGDLTITDATGGADRMLHVPVTAPQEYPYAPTTPTSWPCSDRPGRMASGVPAYDCSSTDVFTGHVHFRGFLYVKGNLRVNVANWNMVGALVVGDTSQSVTGQLIIPSGDSLHLAYDDIINHAVLVNPMKGTSLKLVADTLEEVSAS